MDSPCKVGHPTLDVAKIYPQPHQDPLKITFDAGGLFVLSCSLLLGIHFLSQGVMTSILLLLPLSIYIQNDYSNFISLGPGGTPPTFWGYLRIVYFRIFSQRNPFSPPRFQFPIEGRGQLPGILSEANLPHRIGPRPSVAGIAPQRQLDQIGTLSCYYSLRRSLRAVSKGHSENFSIGISSLEKHGFAMFAKRPIVEVCRGEICHVHSSDKSLHLCLSSDDIGEVLRKGWGQRHPLARDSPWPPMPVPREFVMIYAPRGQYLSSPNRTTVFRYIE